MHEGEGRVADEMRGGGGGESKRCCFNLQYWVVNNFLKFIESNNTKHLK